jgi:hypothetical protein
VQFSLIKRSNTLSFSSMKSLQLRDASNRGNRIIDCSYPESPSQVIQVSICLCCMDGAEGTTAAVAPFSWPTMPLAGLQRVWQEMAVGLR